MRNPGERPVFAYRSTPFMKKGGSAYVDKGRVKEPCKNVSEQILLAAFAGEPDLWAIPQRISADRMRSTQRITS